MNINHPGLIYAKSRDDFFLSIFSNQKKQLSFISKSIKDNK